MVMFRIADRPKLKHFKPQEFGFWYPVLDYNLLVLLDELRERWGYPIIVSSADGSMGRYGGDSHSQHNIDRWGKVRAIDVFPKILRNGVVDYVRTEHERARLYEIAKAVGFTGIGIYTDTEPGNMLHLDTRSNRAPGDPAQWSRVAGEYGKIEEVIGYG